MLRAVRALTWAGLAFVAIHDTYGLTRAYEWLSKSEGRFLFPVGEMLGALCIAIAVDRVLSLGEKFIDERL